MQLLKQYADWFFKDMNGRRGGYVIVETPNVPLILFVISIVLGVVLNPGFLQSFFMMFAFVCLFVWGILEAGSGRSRFRKLLGLLGLLSVMAALAFWLGL